MARFEPHQEVGSVVSDAPATARVFEQYGIDYCCAGRRSLSEACAEGGLDQAAVLTALEEAAASQSEPEQKWSEVAITLLLDHIVEKHHTYLRRELPRLSGLMDKVEEVHGGAHEEIWPELSRIYRNLAGELTQHMMKEEQVLFPAIRSLEGGSGLEIACGHLDGPIHVMEMEHQQAGLALERMRRITGGYELPDDACPSWTALYAGLEELERDLHTHIHLENNLVHPRALGLLEMQ